LFPPEGDRGACPGIRATNYGATSWFDFMKRNNEEVVISVIIERLEGVRNAAEICSVKGISLVWCGFFDLAMEVGVRPIGESALSETADILKDPIIEGYTNNIIQIAKEKGVYIANIASDAGSALNLVKRGCQFIATPPDTNMYVATAKEFLTESKVALKKSRLL